MTARREEDVEADTRYEDPDAGDLTNQYSAPRRATDSRKAISGLRAAINGFVPHPNDRMAHDDLNALEAEVARLSGERDRANEEKLVLWRRWQDEIGERERLREALREACLHQGLPEDAPPERVAAHFRNNREYREGFAALSAGAEQEGEDAQETLERLDYPPDVRRPRPDFDPRVDYPERFRDGPI